MAARLSLWRGPLRTGLHEWRNARCYWVETGVPLRSHRMQDVARRFSGRPREAIPAKKELGLGCERFYFTPPALLQLKELPSGWGLLEVRKGKVTVLRRSARDLRTPAGFAYEMNLLLASLRRVEIRIEPQTITEFLKWKNRMQQYNGGTWPAGMEPTQEEQNYFLETAPEPMHHKPRRDRCPHLSSRAKLDQKASSAIRPEVRFTARHKNKTGLVGPVSSGVELRCGYITLRRDLAPRVLRSVWPECHCRFVPAKNCRRREEHALAIASAMPI